MKEKALKYLHSMAKPEQIQKSLRFFKTDQGSYGYGDEFIGVTTPEIRKVVKLFQMMPLSEVSALLYSGVHEERLLALLIMVAQYSDKNADEALQKAIFLTYIEHSDRVNNWDLVDSSAPHIVGDYLLSREKELLYGYARSDSLWQRRIAIVASFAFIKQDQFEDTLAIAEILLFDRHDLIHKAVGWMLREVGKRDLDVELAFLNKYYKAMPRTMLRYAIEKFDEELRQKYLQGKI
ncbi:MAG: DNA alkylation repair protein [Sulfurimonas sp.]|nr:DNA alkylation repair protein [Sulfurimonas sp.]